MVFGSNYLHKVFNPVTFRQTLGVVNSILATIEVPFDAIAVRGISGASVGFGLSALYEHQILYVRKETASHGWIVEGPREEVDRYVIVDDFIDSGNTIKELIKTIANRTESLAYRARPAKFRVPKCVGIVLYNADSFSQGREKFDDIQIYVASLWQHKPRHRGGEAAGWTGKHIGFEGECVTSCPPPG